MNKEMKDGHGEMVSMQWQQQMLQGKKGNTQTVMFPLAMITLVSASADVV